MATPTSSPMSSSTLKVEMAREIMKQAGENLQKYALNPTQMPQESLNVTLAPKRSR